ncbi:MAG: BNR repeat-containing protein [Planctomycetaceae bacterium]|nr:BNR repeat-containing protein [Planctomycetaceae bacterium]
MTFKQYVFGLALILGTSWMHAAERSEVLLNTKDTGFRGIWYYNQKLDNEYVYKYSGGLGTYCTNHYPFSVYAPQVDKTFFCYGGTDQKAHENDAKTGTLLHEVSYFDHKTGQVARPTILLDKKTSDAHDNPVLSIDEEGYLWIFSTSHGTGRPSYISRSKKPYCIDEFELVPVTKQMDGKDVPMDNFSYFQVWNVPGKGFIVFFTTYDNRILNDPKSKAIRVACFMTSRDGITWSEWKPIAGIVLGHYQNGAVWQDKKVGSAFNYHPNDPPRVGLNYRTNLYYVESTDFGETWQTVDGTPLEMPLRDKDIDSPARIRDYRSQNLNVYVMDLVYDQAGRPVILYMTSRGYESGPENDPRTWYVARWNGEAWDFSEVTDTDNNYDYGSLFLGENGTWHIVGTPGIGPQAYNTGGEVSLWVSRDDGKTWALERQMTENSEYNHCFPRRTVNAHPDFYAIWADGHGRQKSKSRLYFCNEKGDVFRLPEVMTGDFAFPEKLGQ